MSEGYKLLGKNDLHGERLNSFPESFFELFVFVFEQFDTDVEEGRRFSGL